MHLVDKEFLGLGEEITVLKGTLLTQEYAKADYLYLLQQGKINVYIHIEEKPKPLLVGKICKTMSPLGWSGLNLPNRYTNTLKVQSKTAKLLRFKRVEVEEKLKGTQEGVAFYKWLCTESRYLIKETANLLAGESLLPNSTVNLQGPELLPREDREAFSTFRKSPFFEIFEEEFLHQLSKSSVKQLYSAGQSIFQQDTETKGLFLLINGQVDYFLTDTAGKEVPLRDVSTSGYILGWSGLLEFENINSAVAKTPTEVLFVPKESILEALGDSEEIAIRFYKRILWLITHQLQALRARMVMKKYDQEWLSIQSLVEQNASRLALDSTLHKLPMLLKNPVTLKDAFQMLENTKMEGTAQEKYIATNSLEILKETRKESNFYNSLIKVYQEVSNQPAESNPLYVRKSCALGMQRAFEETDYKIDGWENLPEESGHIFIYNHLKNHEYNTLPNRFQITLDSHFISAMVLQQKYGDPGLRIVRIGRGTEYGHQDYYEKQGHINVFTPESDVNNLTKEQKVQMRQAFFAEASSEISQNRNLIISPEGTSYHTEESPGPFKPGAFNLALNIDPEPLIVPIIMLNFDRRARYNTFKCEILKPFKVSDFLPKQYSREQMSDFLIDYQRRFDQDIFRKMHDFDGIVSQHKVASA